MNMAVLPNKIAPKRHRHHARLTVAPPTPKAEAITRPESEWDTCGMLRTLSAKYPNLDRCLLGWTLLACRLQLPPDETRANIVAAAERLIRSDLYDAAARVAKVAR